MPEFAVVWAFTLAAFAGATLLFLVQPMFARLVLPHLGGSPAVWNTCMLFFQGCLLLGYLYVHVATRVISIHRYLALHLVLLCVALVALPFTVSSPDEADGLSPIVWLLNTATLSVGLPFFLVSTTAPLLQRWFAVLPIASARDPYFLYAASNVGSMVALLSYPLVIEPLMGLEQQTRLWAWGYVVLLVLTGVCARAVRVCARESSRATSPPGVDSIAWRDRLFWMVMAFVPSSLMLGVTTHISTDIAAFPLLWIVPLALYLLTFVIAFSSSINVNAKPFAAPSGLLAFATLVLLLLNVDLVWLIPLHLATFCVSAQYCHLRLANTRPAVSGLTEFYIWLSLGGVMGGVFNGLIAPSVFPTVLEYPVALAAMVLIAAVSARAGRPAPVSLRMGLLGLAAVLLPLSFLVPSTLNRMKLIAAAVVAAVTVLERRDLGTTVRILVLLAMIGVVLAAQPWFAGTVLHTERSFFGVHRVVEAQDRSHRVLYHGSTLHGWQALPAVGCEPSSYYSRQGPIGDVFAQANGGFRRVAVVGLGTGALACYAGPGDSWTFYEIDAAVERIARNPAYFTHMSNSASDLEVIVADGRRGLRSAPEGSYDLLILDAFSSDSIPVHLVTREAIELYFSRLTGRGIVAIHISNRHLQLEPALAALAQALGLRGYIRTDGTIPPEGALEGRTSSRWVVLARDPADLLGLDRLREWRLLDGSHAVRVWTDDYSNVLEALLLNYAIR